MKKEKTKRLNRRRIKKRGNSRYYVLYLFIALSVLASFQIAFSFAKKMDLFLISHISITGNDNLNNLFIEQMAEEFIGQNLFSVNKQVISVKYENIVRIKKVKVYRIIPNRLRINIQERVGYAYLKTTEGKLIPLDEEMVILDNRGFYLSEDLPVINTDLSKEALTAGAVLENEYIARVMDIHRTIERSRINANSISEYYSVNNNLYIVEANTGTRICIGNDNYEEKINKLEFVWNNVGIEKHTAIDLRFKNQVVFRTMDRR